MICKSDISDLQGALDTYYVGVMGLHGFAWQGFGSAGAIGVASLRSCEKLPPCLIKPVPAGS